MHVRVAQCAWQRKCQSLGAPRRWESLLQHIMSGSMAVRHCSLCVPCTRPTGDSCVYAACQAGKSLAATLSKYKSGADTFADVARKAAAAGATMTEEGYHRGADGGVCHMSR